MQRERGEKKKLEAAETDDTHTHTYIQQQQQQRDDGEMIIVDTVVLCAEVRPAGPRTQQQQEVSSTAVHHIMLVVAGDDNKISKAWKNKEIVATLTALLATIS